MHTVRSFYSKINVASENSCPSSDTSASPTLSLSVILGVYYIVSIAECQRNLTRVSPGRCKASCQPRQTQCS